MVVMSALVCNYRIFLENIDIGTVVVQVIEDGIMVDTQDLHARLDHRRERAVEPQQVFLLDVAVPHLHERTAIHTHDHQIVHSKDKAICPPNVIESLASALAPVVLVVAGDDIQWMGDTVENSLDIIQLFVTALVGQVTRQQDSIDAGAVDFGYRLA